MHSSNKKKIVKGHSSDLRGMPPCGEKKYQKHRANRIVRRATKAVCVAAIFDPDTDGLVEFVDRGYYD